MKQGGITCVGDPAIGDDGKYTNCIVHGGISIGDKNGFHDDWTQSTNVKKAFLTTYNCVAIDPVQWGFINYKAVNCEHSGAGEAKYAATTVVSTSRLGI